MTSFSGRRRAPRAPEMAARANTGAPRSAEPVLLHCKHERRVEPESVGDLFDRKSARFAGCTKKRTPASCRRASIHPRFRRSRSATARACSEFGNSFRSRVLNAAAASSSLSAFDVAPSRSTSPSPARSTRSSDEGPRSQVVAAIVQYACELCVSFWRNPPAKRAPDAGTSRPVRDCRALRAQTPAFVWRHIGRAVDLVLAVLTNISSPFSMLLVAAEEGASIPGASGLLGSERTAWRKCFRRPSVMQALVHQTGSQLDIDVLRILTSASRLFLRDLELIALQVLHREPRIDLPGLEDRIGWSRLRLRSSPQRGIRAQLRRSRVSCAHCKLEPLCCPAGPVSDRSTCPRNWGRASRINVVAARPPYRRHDASSHQQVAEPANHAGWRATILRARKSAERYQIDLWHHDPRSSASSRACCGLSLTCRPASCIRRSIIQAVLAFEVMPAGLYISGDGVLAIDRYQFVAQRVVRRVQGHRKGDVAVLQAGRSGRHESGSPRASPGGATQVVAQIVEQEPHGR